MAKLPFYSSCSAHQLHVFSAFVKCDLKRVRALIPWDYREDIFLVTLFNAEWVDLLEGSLHDFLALWCVDQASIGIRYHEQGPLDIFALVFFRQHAACPVGPTGVFEAFVAYTHPIVTLPAGPEAVAGVA